MIRTVCVIFLLESFQWQIQVFARSDKEMMSGAWQSQPILSILQTFAS